MAADYAGLKLTIAALSVAATVLAWSYFQSLAVSEQQSQDGANTRQADQAAARQRTSRGS